MLLNSVRTLVFLRDRSRDVGGQLVTLKCHQRSDNLRAEVALDSLLIVVGRGQALLVAGLLHVLPKLQIVAESAIAAAAGQGTLTTDHDRHRAIHHRDDVAVAPLEQVRVHRLVVLAPKVAGGASVAAADL